jgi:hypothetical protein
MASNWPEVRERIIALARELASSPPAALELAMRNNSDSESGARYQRQVVMPVLSKERS